jgi:hypothetical protein
MFETKRLNHGVALSRLIATGAVLLVLPLAAGCDAEIFKSRFFVPPPYVIAPHGDATAQNNAVMVVNPNPPAHQQPPNLNGLRARVAIRRYHSNREIAPADPGVVGGGGND